MSEWEWNYQKQGRKTAVGAGISYTFSQAESELTNRNIHEIREIYRIYEESL